MADDPKPTPVDSWVDRLPGHPGAPTGPVYGGSPEGYYSYIIQNVPGISEAAAQWLHAAILGGRPFTAGEVGVQVPGGFAPVANPGASGYPDPSSGGLPYGGLTPAQMAAIMTLPGGMAGASSVQPDVPGGAHYGTNAGTLVPGVPGQPGWRVPAGATTAKPQPAPPAPQPPYPNSTVPLPPFPQYVPPPGWVPDMDPAHGTPVTPVTATPPVPVPRPPRRASRVVVRRNHPYDVPYR